MHCQNQEVRETSDPVHGFMKILLPYWSPKQLKSKRKLILLIEEMLQKVDTHSPPQLEVELELS